jgi:nucleoid-associated protein YgaU
VFDSNRVSNVRHVEDSMNIASYDTPRPAIAGRPTRPAGPAPAGTLRLTRRGRVVVVALVLLAAFAFLVLRGNPASSSDTAHHAHPATVVVAPGETVWDIARRVEPNADPRDVVAQIEQLNSLTDPGAVEVGQPLFVPGR